MKKKNAFFFFGFVPSSSCFFVVFVECFGVILKVFRFEKYKRSSLFFFSCNAFY